MVTFQAGPGEAEGDVDGEPPSDGTGVLVTVDATSPERRDEVPPVNITAKIITIKITTIYIVDAPFCPEDKR